MARLAVIIPAYNPDRLLLNAIESLKEQNLNDLQIIVVDDGSSAENSLRLFKEIEFSAKVVRQPNKGPGAARNLGVRCCDSEYLLFLDADDLLPENFLQVMLSVGISSGADLVCCGWREIDGRGEVIRRVGLPENETDTLRQLTERNIFAIHCVLCRRHAFESVGGFDETLRQHEDWDLWLRIAEKGPKFRFVRTTEAIYRRLPGTNSGNSEGMDFTLALVLKRALRIARRANTRGSHRERFHNALNWYLHQHVFMKIKDPSVPNRITVAQFIKRAWQFPELVPAGFFRAVCLAFKRLG